MKRPSTIVVLAISADGKISDSRRSPVLFGSPVDMAHLEKQVAGVDAVLVGSGTLMAGGSAMRVTEPRLLQEREAAGLPPQPVQIICSRTGAINPEIKFFSQPIPRWLVTTKKGENIWKNTPEFDKIIALETPDQDINLPEALQQIYLTGISRLAVLGGGQLIASLIAQDLIDEFWLTVCPLIIGGATAPTPVDGKGFFTEMAPRLELLEVKPIANEVFLHYRLHRQGD